MTTLKLAIWLIWLGLCAFIAMAAMAAPECPFCSPRNLRCRVQSVACTNTTMTITPPGWKESQTAYVGEAQKVCVTGCGMVFVPTKGEKKNGK